MSNRPLKEDVVLASFLQTLVKKINDHTAAFALCQGCGAKVGAQVGLSTKHTCNNTINIPPCTTFVVYVIIIIILLVTYTCTYVVCQRVQELYDIWLWVFQFSTCEHERSLQDGFL